MPFAYSFLDEDFRAQYESEERLGEIFTYIAFLAIFIACLGLFGLAAFTAEQRTKEIGVRKVLGATVPGIILLLSKDFLKLVAIACVIAIPLGYFVAQKWLEDFAYHIDLGVGIFLAASGLAVLIALVTVSYQAIKAAVANPVKSLRYE
jgi:putative ABC transport system permease protein